MWDKESFEEMKAELYERSTNDADFRQLCLNDPNTAVKEVSGMDIPEGLQVKFHSNEPSVRHFVLPEFAPVSQELSEKELDAVSGAWGNWTGTGI